MPKKSKKSKQKRDTQSDKAIKRLTEMVIDHLGIPRPGTSKHIEKLRDTLLPTFMQLSRRAHLASSTAMTEGDPSYDSFHHNLEGTGEQVDELDDILDELGVYALLEDIAESPEAKILNELPVPLYDERVLSATGRSDPEKVIRDHLQQAAKEPEILSSSSEKVEKASQVVYKVYSNKFFVLPTPNETDLPPNEARKRKRKRRKLIPSITTLFQGLALVTGNVILVPTVPLGTLTALPVLTSSITGIGMVAEGVVGISEAIDPTDDTQDNTVSTDGNNKPPTDDIQDNTVSIGGSKTPFLVKEKSPKGSGT